MPFSAATCLTFTAETQLGPTLYFFSDADNYTDSFGSAPTSDLVAPNCPFVITGIPDGSLYVRLRDYQSGCCIDILIESSSLCSICNFFFDVLESGTALITAGNLEGTCTPEPTDYVVNWYGPDSTENVGYTSGIGSLFGYQFQHPLTGTSAIFAEAGTYVPVIHKIVVDGVSYSNVLTPGFYPAALNCFSPVTVGALRCNNGNQPTSAYTHFYQFVGIGQGVEPSPLSATFELSSTTKFYPFEFRAEGVFDTLTLTLNSSNYDVPIVLESIRLGDGVGSNFTTFPRVYQTQGYVNKVLTLTGFTFSEGDSLTVEIAPNTANTATRWYFGCKCRSEFDCSTCLDNYISSPYPILSGSVSTSLLTCDRVRVAYDVSGCTQNEIQNTDIYQYMGFEPGQTAGVFANNTTKRISHSSADLFFSNIECNVSAFSFTCASPNSNTITYLKTTPGGVGNLRITCGNISDFNAFYNQYISIATTYSGNPTNSNDVDYYRGFVVGVPNPVTSQCGDGTTFDSYPIHFSSVVTTGGTGPWFVNFTMPTMLNTITFSSCDLNCQSRVNSTVSAINSASSGTTNEINETSNNGNRANIPIRQYRVITITTETQTGDTEIGYSYLRTWQNETIGWTGISNTYVPQFSGQVCTFDTWNKTNSTYLYKTLYYYKTILINPSNVEDFEIWGSPIVNASYSGFPGTYETTLALRYSGGVITYADPYFVK